MDENNDKSFTYQYEKTDPKKTEKSLRVVFGIVIAALFVLAVLLGVYFGMKSGAEPETTTQAAETTTAVPETTTEAPATYEPGYYSVNTATLLFRKDHSATAETILGISQGTKISVLEVFVDEAAQGDYKYWGKISYLGYTGWVAMSYLTKEYSNGVVTPDDTKMTETDKYALGEYIVNVGAEYTLTLRELPTTDGSAILSISNGDKVTVEVVYDTENTNESYRYWGRITYLGHTGYVSMAYLTK